MPRTPLLTIAREGAPGGVHPGSPGRGEVVRPVGMARQPFTEFGRSAGGDLAGDDMNRAGGLDLTSDMIGEGGEFIRAMPLYGLADHHSVALSSMTTRQVVAHRLSSCALPRHVRAGGLDHLPGAFSSRHGWRQTLEVFTWCGRRAGDIVRWPPDPSARQRSRQSVGF